MQRQPGADRPHGPDRVGAVEPLDQDDVLVVRHGEVDGLQRVGVEAGEAGQRGVAKPRVVAHRCATIRARSLSTQRVMS